MREHDATDRSQVLLWHTLSSTLTMQLSMTGSCDEDTIYA
jgi:hypothetical protein